jgi:DNA-binding LacI/PurR family transcriptional regulator
MRPLADELEVSVHTVRAAIRLLVRESLLTEGTGREACRILATGVNAAPAERRQLRVAILIHRPLTRQAGALHAELLSLVGEMRRDGHDCFFVNTPDGKDSQKTGYLPQLVESNAADAWVVYRSNLEVLRWFEAKGVPALAAGGRSEESILASATFCMKGALRELVRRLVALGHRRLVMISAGNSRRPEFSPLLRAFRDELEKAGVKPGEYHTPDWDESPAGLVVLLDSLFKVTPPTALICWHPNSAFGLISWLVARRIKVPEELSVFTLHDDSAFGWLLPGLTLAHIEFNGAFWNRRVREWLRSVAAGSPDRLALTQGVKLVVGNTLGPVKPGCDP